MKVCCLSLKQEVVEIIIKLDNKTYNRPKKREIVNKNLGALLEIKVLDFCSALF